MHCAGAVEGGGGLDPQGGTRRSRVDTRGAGNCAKMVLHVTQAGRGLVRRQAGRVPRDPGRPRGQFLATGVLHLGHRVVRGQVRVAALCGVGARHRVQPGKEQRENGHSATHAGAHSSPVVDPQARSVGRCTAFYYNVLWTVPITSCESAKRGGRSISTGQKTYAQRGQGPLTVLQ